MPPAKIIQQHPPLGRRKFWILRLVGSFHLLPSLPSLQAAGQASLREVWRGNSVETDERRSRSITSNFSSPFSLLLRLVRLVQTGRAPVGDDRETPSAGDVTFYPAFHRA